MTLDAASYYQHIQAYLSDNYIVHRGDGGEIILKEKYFKEGATKKSDRIIKLSYRGSAFAIKLDGQKGPLFGFLDDNGKEWSKRCDFIVFQCHARKMMVYLFEFKSKSLDVDSIKAQLKSGVHWCACLRKIIEQYTGDSKPLKLKQFVLTENTNPGVYLDAEARYLARERSIRHYHYDTIKGMALEDLDNDSVKTV
jgi:hypothetical protein